jgi:hypothetical protein
MARAVRGIEGMQYIRRDVGMRGLHVEDEDRADTSGCATQRVSVY